jgi:hypothetical protein
MFYLLKRHSVDVEYGHGLVTDLVSPNFQIHIILPYNPQYIVYFLKQQHHHPNQIPFN